MMAAFQIFWTILFVKKPKLHHMSQLSRQTDQETDKPGDRKTKRQTDQDTEIPRDTQTIRQINQ